MKTAEEILRETINNTVGDSKNANYLRHIHQDIALIAMEEYKDQFVSPAFIQEGKPLEEITDEEISNLLDCTDFIDTNSDGAEGQKPFNKMTRFLYSLWNKLSSVPVTETYKMNNGISGTGIGEVEFLKWVNKNFKENETQLNQWCRVSHIEVGNEWLSADELYPIFLSEQKSRGNIQE